MTTSPDAWPTLIDSCSPPQAAAITATHEAATDWEGTVDRAKSNLLDFTRFTKADYVVNWHHRLVAKALDRVVSGGIKRLLIVEPPRHGKSEQFSRRLPAFALGRNPDERIIACSYADSLASAMNRDVQRIIDSSDYAILFPGTRLMDKNVRASSFGHYVRTSDLFEIVGHSGYYRSAGVGGGITGHGFSLGIVDDPIKSREEADSPTIREKVWQWYTNDFITRQGPGARIVVGLTRWHRDDLAGRLLRQERDQWTVLHLPGLRGPQPTTPPDSRKEGEALWPDQMDRATHLRQRELDRQAYAALYDGNPAEAGGAEWLESDFGLHVWCPAEKWPANSDFRLRIVAVDPSKGKSDKHGDYSAIVFLGVHKNGLLYVDCTMDRRPVNKIVRDTLEFCRVYEPHMVGIESNQFQELMVGEFDRQSRGLWGTLGFRAYGVNNTLNKVFRIRRLTPYIVDRELRFKADSPGCRLLVDQLIDFPNAAYDDGPDALEMAVRLPAEVGELARAE